MSSDKPLPFPRPIFRPDHAAEALPEKSEGARDAGDPPDPRAQASREAGADADPGRERHLGISSKPQVRLLSSVPRAVFVRLSSAGPPVV